MNDEKVFFNDIAQKCLQHVEDSIKTNSIKTHKAVLGDYATELDVSVENLIVEEISKRFSDDEILAEEGYSETKISDGRIWVIDPICGTTNLGRNITLYCTNIALVEGGEIIASCVVDYSQKEYFWSVGEGVFVSSEKLEVSRPDNGRIVDVDYGAVMKASTDTQDWFGRVVADMTHEEGWMVTSMNSSLSFLYVANRKIDAVINVRYNPWDVCASVFLVRQMGGKVTDFDGNDWVIDSGNVVLSLDNEVHDRVLRAIKSA